jgi:hypothetical protein
LNTYSYWIEYDQWIVLHIITAELRCRTSYIVISLNLTKRTYELDRRRSTPLSSGRSAQPFFMLQQLTIHNPGRSLHFVHGTPVWWLQAVCNCVHIVVFGPTNVANGVNGDAGNGKYAAEPSNTNCPFRICNIIVGHLPIVGNDSHEEELK